MDKSASPSSLAPPIAILGVPFDNVSIAQTIDLIDQMIASGRPHYLATANVDFLVQASKDVELRRILFDAHLVICDGTPLVWASALLGNPLPERVAGSDLVPLLLKHAAQKGYRPFFLGGTLGAAEEAIARLAKELPALQVAGHYAPPYRKLLDMDQQEIIQRIQAAKPDLLFVGFGCPKQEKWIWMHYRNLGIPVAVGVGATIDFLAGKVKRAPVWMQKSGTEWIFRLAQEPRRLFKRYAVDLWEFSGAIVKQWWRLSRRRKGRVYPPQPAIRTEPDCHIIPMPSRLDTEAVHRYRPGWEQSLFGTQCCVLDLSVVDFIDSTGIGLLIRFQKAAASRGAKLALLKPASVVERALKMMRLTDFFTIVPDLATARRLSQQETILQSVMIKYQNSNRTLAWQGELTAANAPEVWDLTKAHIGTWTRHDGEILIDMEGLRFIDSTGLGTMIRVKKYALREGLQVRFQGIQLAVKNVLHIAQLEEFLLGSK